MSTLSPEEVNPTVTVYAPPLLDSHNESTAGVGIAPTAKINRGQSLTLNELRYLLHHAMLDQSAGVKRLLDAYVSCASDNATGSGIFKDDDIIDLIINQPVTGQLELLFTFHDIYDPDVRMRYLHVRALCERLISMGIRGIDAQNHCIDAVLNKQLAKYNGPGLRRLEVDEMISETRKAIIAVNGGQIGTIDTDVRANVNDAGYGYKDCIGWTVDLCMQGPVFLFCAPCCCCAALGAAFCPDPFARSFFQGLIKESCPKNCC